MSRSDGQVQNRLTALRLTRQSSQIAERPASRQTCRYCGWGAKGRSCCRETLDVADDPFILRSRLGSLVMLQFHVAISVVGILSGLAMLYGLLVNRNFTSAIAVFLATTILTSLTGFPLPPFGFDPPRAVGVLSLILLDRRGGRLLRLPPRGAMAMDLRRLRGGGALSQCVRACRAGIHEGPGPSRTRADAIRAAVRDRPGDRAVDLHWAGDMGRDQVSAADRSAAREGLDPNSSFGAGC